MPSIIYDPRRVSDKTLRHIFSIVEDTIGTCEVVVLEETSGQDPEVIAVELLDGEGDATAVAADLRVNLRTSASFPRELVSGDYVCRIEYRTSTSRGRIWTHNESFHEKVTNDGMI